MKTQFLLSTLLVASAAQVQAQNQPKPPAKWPTTTTGSLSVSGIYPHLAFHNDWGGQIQGECGIGAIVPWAGKLWVITYPPHVRTGGDDKLYEISPDLTLKVRPESVGGTHAARMIHKESNQLIIGPYFIDDKGNVRAVDVKKALPGRLTAVARHLTDPANKVLFYDMEGPVAEVDVHTLEARRLFVKPVPGWHGKGAYTGQGRFIVANNGAMHAGDLDKLPWEMPAAQWSKGPEEAGVLAEWDGKAWTIISRRSHTDVTGPGGINGAPSEGAPVWSPGWDKRSILLHVRSGGAWSVYRLPKGSYTFDPAHGWFTEWPRIRDTGDGRYLMNMHGTFYDFPPAFAPGKIGGLRPLSTHLHYTSDWALWNGKLVIGGDDTSVISNPIPSRAQSNLRFLDPGDLTRKFGPASGWGGVWMHDAIKANTPSDPLLIAGYTQRCLHLANEGAAAQNFSLELDANGDGTWKPWRTVSVAAHGYEPVILPADAPGQWLRISGSQDGVATAYLHAQTPQAARADAAPLFAALAPANAPHGDGLLRPAPFSRDLQFLAKDGSYYEIDEQLNFNKLDAPDKVAALQKAAAVKTEVQEDNASLFVVDSKKRKWRLPKGVAQGTSRGLREVISERFLADFGGTFYEIPRLGTEAIPDYQHMKPVATHNFDISDFCTWRGLLVLAGTRAEAHPDGQFFGNNGNGLWFGAIDDLYALGTPRGQGGPWLDTPVTAGQASDPYLMTNYATKILTLRHNAAAPVTFRLEVDFLADGTWQLLKEITVPAGQTVTYDFPTGFGAHWARLVPNTATTATAQFSYS